MAEQNALRKQLHQEQELLQRFQESQEEKLKGQHQREKAALDVKVEDSKKELEKVVRGLGTALVALNVAGSGKVELCYGMCAPNFVT